MKRKNRLIMSLLVALVLSASTPAYGESQSNRQKKSQVVEKYLKSNRRLEKKRHTYKTRAHNVRRTIRVRERGKPGVRKWVIEERVEILD